jgi:hypothetical protein
VHCLLRKAATALHDRNRAFYMPPTRGMKSSISSFTFVHILDHISMRLVTFSCYSMTVLSVYNVPHFSRRCLPKFSGPEILVDD